MNPAFKYSPPESQQPEPTPVPQDGAADAPKE